MNQSPIRNLRRIFYGVLATCLLALPAVPVHAAAPGSLYSYALDGSSALISNNALSNQGVSLNLLGNWAATTFGVKFEGNLTNKQSVGYAKPASGSTLYVPANQAAGASVKFTYQAPSKGCFSDSPNVTQIGKYGSGLTQFKLQLSNCGKSKTTVYPQCRVAGSAGANDVKTGTTPLVNGATYVLQCVKSPDPTSGSATLQLNLVKIDTANTYSTNTFSIKKTGTLNSSQYLSVANQYPLKSQTNNTDQFNGEIAQLAYCSGATTADAVACLNTEVPF